MDSSESEQVSGNQTIPEFFQNVIVMRHGDRLDNFDPLWVSTASKPWDPPLFKDGLIRAYKTGRILRNRLGFPIHRVFVSPFIRCVQTAAQVVSALCAAADDSAHVSSGAVSIDPSKLKVSIEYGLCEMLSRVAIRQDVAPKDGNWGFNIPELEALLPAGTVDPHVERVYKEMPKWEESVTASRSRYEQIFQTLADKFPSENLLLVTHGEGVGVAVSSFMEDCMVFGVDYCAYAELRRPIFKRHESFAAGKFKVLTRSEQTGVKFSSFTASNQ